MIRTGALKVLVVDGDLEVCDQVRLILESRGHRVWTAYDGARGLEAVLKCKPDLVILELHLRELSGYELLVRLKRDPRTVDIPVMVLTNLTKNDLRSDEDWRARTGAEAFLSKPIDLSTFLEGVEQAVAGHAKATPLDQEETAKT